MKNGLQQVTTEIHQETERKLEYGTNTPNMVSQSAQNQFNVCTPTEDAGNTGHAEVSNVSRCLPEGITKTNNKTAWPTGN